MHREHAMILALALSLTACSSVAHQPPALQTAHATSGTPRPGPDPSTAAALVRIAQAFNNDYDHNNDGPVYDRRAALPASLREIRRPDRLQHPLKRRASGLPSLGCWSEPQPTAFAGSGARKSAYYRSRYVVLATATAPSRAASSEKNQMPARPARSRT